MTHSRRAFVALFAKSGLSLSGLAMSGLAGCGALSAASDAAEPLDTYTLSPLPPTTDRLGGRGHIVVELPTAGGSLATDRILIKPSTLQAQYLPDGRWSDPAPALVQTLIVGSLLNRASFRLVTRVGAGLMPDYTLMTEIQTFQAEFAGPEVTTAQVRIVLQMTLIRESDRAIAASRRIAATAPATSDSTFALVAGFDAAMQSALAEAVTWVTGAT
jgi:cholesterol transport system auxiliary component